MSLLKINYSTAEKIINLFTDLLIDTAQVDLYNLSHLKGYDIIDFSNSIKLMVAYHVYSVPKIDDKKLNAFEDYASNGDIAFSSFFLQDDLSEKFIDLKNLDLRNNIKERETSKSFLYFCLAIIHGDRSKFWDKVMIRLNIECETVNTQDKIYDVVNKSKLKIY